MSLKHNVVANYIGKVYTAIIGMVMVPVFLRYLGKEAYGLVGFYAVLSGWLALLDLGLTPAFAWVAARYRGGAVKPGEFRSLLRLILLLFSGTGLAVVLAVAALSGFITSHWLKIEALSWEEVRTAIVLMGLVFALRWPAEIYRSILAGFERQVWLNIINVIMATLRFIGVLPVFMFIGATPRNFFLFQALMAAIELLFLRSVTHRLLPGWPQGEKRSWSLAPILDLRGFALSSSALSLIWLATSQTDKLILTRLLPLSKYAYYSVAALAASGVHMMMGAITQAVIPRLTLLASKKDDSGFLFLYGKTTRMVAVLAGSAAVILAAYPQSILWVWTGDMDLSVSAAPVLAFSGLGYAFLAISDMQYVLQVARGDLRFLMRGSFFFLLVLVPAMTWAVSQYGMRGASFAWMLVNLLYLLAWVPLVHHHFLPGLHKTWMLHDLLPVASALGAMGILMGFFPIHCDSKLGVIVRLAAWSGITLIVSGLATKEGRTEAAKIKNKCFSYFRRQNYEG